MWDYGFVHIVKENLNDNMYTLQVHNETLDILTAGNQALTAAWTNGSPPAGSDLANILALLQKDEQDGNSTDGALQIGNLIKMMTGGSGDITQFSQAVGTTIMGYLADFYGAVGDAAPADTNVINSYMSVITATGNNEEQIGSNGAKTENSVVQQDVGAQQPIADCGNSIIGILSNVSSLIQQIYS